MLYKGMWLSSRESKLNLIRLSEGSFEAAEVHFLASGKRDSARLLSQMFIEWATPTGAYGIFALRGTIPYALVFPMAHMLN